MCNKIYYYYYFNNKICSWAHNQMHELLCNFEIFVHWKKKRVLETRNLRQSKFQTFINFGTEKRVWKGSCCIKLLAVNFRLYIVVVIKLTLSISLKNWVRRVTTKVSDPYMMFTVVKQKVHLTNDIPPLEESIMCPHWVLWTLKYMPVSFKKKWISEFFSFLVYNVLPLMVI